MRYKFIIVIFLASLILILSYTRLLTLFNINSTLFHISYIISIVSLSLILVKSESAIPLNAKLLLVLIWILTLMLTKPLRLPKGIISNYPDMIYESQIVKNIITRGKFNFNAPTKYAQNYAFNPALEFFTSEISIVSGIDPDVILKYSGPLFGLLTTVFLFCFYKTFIGRKDALFSVFLACCCFHFINFCAHTVHLSFALIYFVLLLYGLVKESCVKWKIIQVLSIFIIVFAHRFTSIMTAFYLFAVFITPFVFSFFGKRKSIFNGKITLTILLFVVLTFSWQLFVSPPLFHNLIALSQKLYIHFVSPAADFRFPLIATTAICTPILIRLIGDLSVITFGLTILLGFLITVKNDWLLSRKYNYFLPFAFAATVIFIIGVLIYAGYREMTDLLPRVYIFIYFSSAPLCLVSIKKFLCHIHSRIHQKIFCICILTLLSLSALYYNYEYYRYETILPLNIEDVRFPLLEWKTVGFFVKNHFARDIEIWGDKIAFNYIGGYGEVDVRLLHKELNITLSDWIYTYPSRNSMIILRKSMSNVPYFNYYLRGEDFNIISSVSNFIYTSGEVALITKWKDS